MKRSLYIIGIILILILIAVWMFLLFADEDTKKDVFNRFGFAGTTEEGIFEDIIDTVIPDIFQKQYLRQLTTKRVIGYTEVATASSTLVYFVEGGTGHLYTIDPMIEGSENRVSNVTIPIATKAAISPDGLYVAIRSGNQPESTLTILNRTGETVDSFTLEEAVRDFTINSSNELLYTSAGGGGLYGKSFNLGTKDTKVIFEVPFREATIVWGSNAGDNHYILPKTSRYLEGYLYKIQEGTFIRTPISGFGLMVNASKDAVLYSYIEDSLFVSQLSNSNTSTQQKLLIAFMPEKCTFGTKALYCADGNEANDHGFPDSWYRGELSFTDNLWRVAVDNGEPGLVVDTLDSSGRELDITNLQAGTDDMLLYFTNKNDQSLWVYEFPEAANSTQ